MVVRCHRSWWSTSATDTLNFWRIPAVRAFTTWRFSLSEVHPGMRRSNRSSATSMFGGSLRGDRSERSERAGDLADVERLDHVAFLDVLEVLQPDAALETLGHL